MEEGTSGIFGVEYEPAVSIDTLLNLINNPMFTNDTTYRLQRGSPLIDAGNPALIDIDGSRSDIGVHGGLWAIPSGYPEEPPGRPDTLVVAIVGNNATFSWPPNTEADLAGYNLYRESFSGFMPDETNLRKTIEFTDTSCTDIVEEGSGDVFYRLTALDTAGWESASSNEVAVLATGILEEEAQGDDSIPETPSLTAYPNPFNSVTTIRFVIPQIGNQNIHVKITIYDILGAQVAVLLNDYVVSGIHTISWSGIDQSSRPLASGIYFATMNVSGVEGVACTKLLLLK